MLRAMIEYEENHVMTQMSPEEEVLKPDIPLAAIAREADSQIGILSEFTDSELESVLTVEFDIRPMHLKNMQKFGKNNWIVTPVWKQ